MKQRQLAKTVLVLIIFFSFGTVLGVVGYLAANNKVNFGGSSTFTRLNPGSAGDISGWKTYKNERYGYEVMYPSYLVPSEQDNGDRVFFNDPVDPQKRMAYEIDMDRSLAGVFGTPNPGTIKEIGKSQERGEKYAKTYWIQEKLNVGGLDGLILRVDQPGLNLYSLFPYHDRWFFISFEGSLDDLRKTLSTLKFNAFEPKKDLGKDLGIDIFSFVPEGTDRSGNRLYKKPRVTDVKVGNIDGDQVKEIVFAIDNDNMN